MECSNPFICYSNIIYLFRDRDRSGTRSENGFILGAARFSSPSKENLDPDDDDAWSLGGQRPRRSARSCSGGRYRGENFADLATAKTYITIEPGKPTRIREHSPSKSAKLTSDETVTKARERSALSRNSSPLKRFDLNRAASPSPQRKTRDNNLNFNELNSSSTEKKKELFRDTSPLKSTNFLKTFRASKSDLFNEVENDNQKRTSQPFTTEKTFLVNQEPSLKGRKYSFDFLNSINRKHEENRASPESDSSVSTSTFSSSFSSPLSSSSESFSDKEKVGNDKLRQRRISLEQRLNARVRINSPERNVTVTRNTSETNSHDNTTAPTTSTTSSATFIYCKSSTCANLYSQKQSNSDRASDKRTAELNNNNINNNRFASKPIPASRKISLQVNTRRPEPAPRRKSLNCLIAPKLRLDFI